MIAIKDMAAAIAAWAVAVVPELQGNYDYPHKSKTQPLPDIAVEIQSVSIGEPPAEGFAELGIEQAHLRLYSFNLLLVVPEEPPEAATDLLTDFVDRLTASALMDPTLGRRVPGVSPAINSTFNPPFVEFDDATKGRLATIELKVGELIDMED